MTNISKNELAESSRIPCSPPKIATVPTQVERPLWSVMIPTYNDLPHLQETMESVLSHKIGPERMQIAVIDDCSTKGDVMETVQSTGGDRIEYFRQHKNVGSLRNFETCINHSNGRWVHILHGDDMVMPGFYEEIEMLFNKYPEAGAAFTNTAHTLAESNILEVHAHLASEPGILNDFLLQNAQRLLLQPPSIVVKRSVYEQLGGFYAAHYGEDWEMWTRIAAHYPIAYSPKCLAHYRYWTNNSITQTFIATGQNVRDIINVINIMQNYIPLDQRARIRRLASKNYALYCLSLADSLFTHDKKAAIVQAKGAMRLTKDLKVFYLFLKHMAKHTLLYRIMT